MTGRDGTDGPSLYSARPAVAPYRCANYWRSVIFRHHVPVNNVPPRLEVISAPVLILQVIGVLPHIDPDNRRIAVHQRAVLIWRGNYFEPSTLPDQPCPSTPEAAHTRGAEFFLKLIEAAESGVDVIREFAFRLAAGIRSHDAPKERVIGM